MKKDLKTPKMKDKCKLNFIIDLMLFMSIVSMTGIGFLIRYTLVPGFERNLLYGKNTKLTFLGMDRHEWGSIHLIISLLFISLLLLHMALHWKTIVCWFKKYIAIKSTRIVLSLVIVVFTITTVMFSFFIEPDVTPLSNSERMHRRKLKPENKETKSTATNQKIYIDSKIRGYMTLAEISEKYNVNANLLKKYLLIPESESDNVRLGLLRERYGFRMNEVKKGIENQLNN